MTTNLTPPNQLTPRQIQAMKRIADGYNADTETFCELLELDLVDSEVNDELDVCDILTQKGWRLLRQIEVVSHV